MDLLPELIDSVSRSLTEYGFMVSPAEGLNWRDTRMRATHHGRRFHIVVSPSYSEVDLREVDERTIVALPTVAPSEQARLIAAGAGGVVDGSGNAHIAAPDGLYVDVRGRAASPLAREVRLRQSRGWSARPTGLRVLFTLLTQPETLDATLTELAERSRVSVATAHRVMTDLMRQGILDEDRAGRFWVERPNAVRSWVEGYVRGLGPKVSEARYVSELGAADWLDFTVGGALDGWLTGGIALAALGAGVHPVEAAVYHAGVPSIPSARIRRPRPGEQANLVVREPWWQPSAVQRPIAPAILVYADALLTADPRIVTVAENHFGGVDGLAAALG